MATRSRPRVSGNAWRARSVAQASNSSTPVTRRKRSARVRSRGSWRAFSAKGSRSARHTSEAEPAPQQTGPRPLPSDSVSDVTLRLALLALLVSACANQTQAQLGPRSSAKEAREHQPVLRPGPRLGPFAGPGSGVRRVDVALR